MRADIFLIQPFVWLRRIRHRCGFGVQSPSDFSFVRDIVYEDWPYYAYPELAKEVHDKRYSAQPHWFDEPKRLRPLLFRLTNFVQPRQIIVSGYQLASSCYMKRACRKALFSVNPEPGAPALPTLLYISNWRKPSDVEHTFETYLPMLDEHSVIVVQGIGYSCAMRKLWKRWKEDGRTGITFDLFHVGIIFLSQNRIKQHYLVNF